jgi:hypothetical protein
VLLDAAVKVGEEAGLPDPETVFHRPMPMPTVDTHFLAPNFCSGFCRVWSANEEALANFFHAEIQLFFFFTPKSDFFTRNQTFLHSARPTELTGSNILAWFFFSGNGRRFRTLVLFFDRFPSLASLNFFPSLSGLDHFAFNYGGDDTLGFCSHV